jgi:hypothetical protein
MYYICGLWLLLDDGMVGDLGTRFVLLKPPWYAWIVVMICIPMKLSMLIHAWRAGYFGVRRNPWKLGFIGKCLLRSHCSLMWQLIPSCAKEIILEEDKGVYKFDWGGGGSMLIPTPSDWHRVFTYNVELTLLHQEFLGCCEGMGRGGVLLDLDFFHLQRKP